ncbi:hypothetical protein ACIQC9_06970 [Brevundimonas sp. NPDC092305]|uniref:hypothetical protein n=1 Tax=Brevundimonas sp. NPDC092305 TaxID=3363957 RepID=UPI003821B7E6
MRLTCTAVCAALSVAAAASPTQAQSFLDTLARRAAAATSDAVSAAAQGVRRSSAPVADASAGSTAIPPERRPDSRSSGPRSNRATRDTAPEAEGMEGLSEDARLRACTARYPLDGLVHPERENRAAQFYACMGPGWGEGG